MTVVLSHYVLKLHSHNMDLLAKIRNIRENHEKDGILSWAICVSALVANAIVVGIDSSFGEALPSIVIEFNSTESKVAWIGSLHSSAQNFSAFFSSVLAKIFGFGPTISFGILISSAFFALSTTSYNVSQLAIYYGFFGGLGIGLVYTPANIICSFHFIKNRALATGIACCGSGVGIVVVSFGANYIDQYFGFKGFVIFRALLCPCCILLAILAILVPEGDERDNTHPNKDNEKNIQDDGVDSP